MDKTIICPEMIKFVRVNKHPDHGTFTWFRLFIDGELVKNFEILDEYADRFEKGTTPTTADATKETTRLSSAIKTGRSFFRGHPLIWIECEDEWVYEDNHADIPAHGGEIRPCKKCGVVFPLGEGEVDPCLGVLPGVDNACCGHGVRSESYVCFTNGVVLEGFIVKESLGKKPEKESRNG